MAMACTEDSANGGYLWRERFGRHGVGPMTAVHGGFGGDLLLAHCGQPLRIQACPSLLEIPPYTKGPEGGHQECSARPAGVSQPAMCLTPYSQLQKA